MSPYFLFPKRCQEKHRVETKIGIQSFFVFILEFKNEFYFLVGTALSPFRTVERASAKME